MTAAGNAEAAAEPALDPVDRVELLTLVDNAIDALLPSTDAVRRAPRDPELGGPKSRLRAEHGYSMLVTVTRGGRRQSVLYDAGLTPDGLAANAEILEVDPARIEAIVLSHGHRDHSGGLMALLRRGVRRGVPLHLHPGAFRRRKLRLPDGRESLLPPPRREELEGEGLAVIARTGPTPLLEGAALLTGQVPRVTSFETGFPGHLVEEDGEWKPDPWIHDDQGLVVNVRGRGLVVVTGCGHAGLVNILTRTRSLVPGVPLHAVVGGFHLTGGAFDPLIPDTVAALKQLAPACVVPGHCTGWKAVHTIIRELPEAFIPNSVGTTFIF
jgi:7,8-dihydropterin-6-yl-methyl-4-(beta-D-ribofuranosyl)aminobenzene 5'-phosphate synthase